MDFKAMDRIMGRDSRLTVRERHVAERREHQFSDDIGGASANYVEPKFGNGDKESNAER